MMPQASEASMKTVLLSSCNSLALLIFPYEFWTFVFITIDFVVRRSASIVPSPPSAVGCRVISEALTPACLRPFSIALQAWKEVRVPLKESGQTKIFMGVEFMVAEHKILQQFSISNFRFSINYQF